MGSDSTSASVIAPRRPNRATLDLSPKLILGRGYIYFADFEDYGLLCFDTNAKVPDHEYPIVYMDHEDVNDIEPYAENFRALMEAHGERGNDFIDMLNERDA